MPNARRRKQRDLTAQFVFSRILNLQGFCAGDSRVFETIFRRIPLTFINNFGSTGAAEGVADRHCDWHRGQRWADMASSGGFRGLVEVCVEVQESFSTWRWVRS
jgi:hypothetical protein